MNLFDKLLYYISVPKCVCCGEILNINESALCTSCLKTHNEHKTRECAACAKVLSKCTCTNDYLKAHYVKRLVKLSRYLKGDRESEDRQKPSNMLIYSLKRDNRADVLDLLSDELSAAIRENLNPCDDFIITSIPRRRKAIIKYGIDHAKLLAIAVAKKLNLPYQTTLKSMAKSAQKKMHDNDRIKNAVFDYAANAPDLSGKGVIIIDDIVTTGASMGSAAMLIHALGAKEIVGAALSIAYRDKSVVFYEAKL